MINLHHGNCLEVMKDIKDKSIDMILCDLPYGTTACSWDTVIPFEPLWEQYERIIKDNGAIVLFAQSPFDKVLACSNLKLYRYEWIWEKTTATGFLNAEKMPLKAHENILVFYKKLPTYNPIKTKSITKVSLSYHKRNCSDSDVYGKQIHKKDYISDERYPRSIITFALDKQVENLHPTQKPINLLAYLIRTYTNENELVLDNTMGSGSTGVACLHTNRKFIGIEKEFKYFEIAKTRIEKEKLTNLFLQDIA